MRSLSTRRGPLERAEARGWVAWAFWFLRVYVALMLIAVVVGFIRGRL